MSEPCNLSDVNTSEIRLARRFSREQGVKPDGSVKLRAVDDETGCGVNEAAQPTTKMKTDTIDEFLKVALLLQVATGQVGELWKADIDSAFRRVPIQPDHRWLAWVAYLVGGDVHVSGHYAMPFGAVGSVHAWERQGALLKHLARVLLRIPISRFVDDFFAPDRAESAGIAMQCFARLVRAVMGVTAIADRKLETGNPLTVLGLDIVLSAGAASVTPSEDKVVKWCGVLRKTLETKTLVSGEASKCAGRLNFAATNAFKRLGRAMIRPFYAQQHAPLKGGRAGPALMLASKWWIQVLELRLSQEVTLAADVETVELFCDARGEPPRLAAVLLDGDTKVYTDLKPSADIMALFQDRSDNQIMGQELLAIALG
jgi:hypothetical protein